MAYTLPPWIRPPGDLASAYISAYRAGAATAEAQARLNVQANEQAQQFAVQEQRLHQQNLLDQQQLQVSKAFHEASIGIKQQELAQTQQRIALTAQSAAEKLAGQAQYQKLRAGGMSATEALLATPSLFPSGAGLASIANAQERQAQLKARGEGTLTEFPELPGYKFLRQNTGYLTPVQRPERSPQSIQQNIQRTSLQHDINEIDKVWGPQLQGAQDVGPDQKAAFESAKARRAQLKALQSGIGSMTVTGTNAPAAPSPYKEGTVLTNKKDGKKYVVRDGQPVPLDFSSSHEEE